MQLNPVPRSSGDAVCIQRVFISLFPIRNHLSSGTLKELVNFHRRKVSRKVLKCLYIYLDECFLRLFATVMSNEEN